MNPIHVQAASTAVGANRDHTNVGLSESKVLVANAPSVETGGAQSPLQHKEHKLDTGWLQTVFGIGPEIHGTYNAIM